MGVNVQRRRPGDVTAAARHTTPRSTSEVANLVIARLHESSDVCVMAQAAVEVASDVLAPCVLAEVSVVDGARVTPVARSGAGSCALNLLIADCGEGPPVTAVATGEAVATYDLLADGRWPCFGPRAARRGVCAALSVPLRLGHEQCALTLYFASGYELDDRDELNAQLIAALLAAAAPFAKELSTLHRALRTRDVIGQAKGIHMERHRLSEEGAFDVLVRASSHTGRKLACIAERLASTGEVDVLTTGRRGR